MNPGIRVITTDGPGKVTHTRQERDWPQGSTTIRGKYWVWVRLDGDPDGPDRLYDGAKVRPE